VRVPDDRRNQVKVGALGIDSCGSFTKIVYYRPTENAAFALPDYVVRADGLTQIPGIKPTNSNNDGVIRFIKIPRAKYSVFIDFVQKKKQKSSFKGEKGNGTGGGAHRLAPQIEEKLKIKVNPMNEFTSLVEGVTFLLETCISDEVFTVDPITKVKKSGVLDRDNCYPFLLASVGSGVSFLKVTGAKQFQRVSGSSLGGGTFWGLCRLLTNEKSYDDVKELSIKGHSENVDLLVGDIYGDNYEAYKALGLPPDVIASSFGKVATAEDKPEPTAYK